MSGKVCNWRYPEVKIQSLIEKTQVYQNFGQEICKQFL